MKKLILALAILSITGCYNKVYFNNMAEAKEAFYGEPNIKFRFIKSPVDPHAGMVEAKYKPF